MLLTKKSDIFIYKKSMLCAVISAGLFAVFLNGCAKSSDSDAGETVGKNGTVKVGIDDQYEPYTYIDDDGELTGIDIKLAEEAFGRMGYTAEFVPVRWDSKKEALKNGEIDCIWSCLSMTGREDEYTWAGPYMNSRIVVAVAAESKIETLSDLDGKRVAVMTGTKPEELLLDDGNDGVPDIERLYVFDNMDVAFASLRKGYSDAVAGHEVAVQRLIGSGSYYRILDDALQTVEVGVAFDKDDADPELVDTLTGTLNDMKSDGTTAEIITGFGYNAANMLKGI